MTRVGLVGAGYIGKFHMQGLRRVPGVQVVGVTDNHPERAQAFAKEFATTAYPSLRALRDAGAEVIHVLTPPASHADLAVEAMSIGCHVFIEKPMATTVEDCARIERAASEYGRVVCVGHSLLYDPFVQRALALVKAGVIGEPLTFDYHRCMNQQSYPAAGASPEQRRGGYPFRDIGIHGLYLAEAFLGPLQQVDGYPMASGRGDCNLWVDEWRAVARCQTGVANIQLSWNVRPQQNVFVVQGTRGILRADMFGLTVTVRTQRPIPEHGRRLLNTLGEGAGMLAQASGNLVRIVFRKIWQFHGIQAMIAEFYARLGRGEAAPVTPADATRAVVWTEHVARQGDDLALAWVQSLTARRVGARVLVTGGTGFIGRSLVKRLIDSATPVRLLVRRPPASSIASHPLIEIVLGDLADARDVDAAVAGVDTVYHIGATMRGSANDFERGTMSGTRNMIESCLRHGVQRLVYMSSLAVIDTDVRDRIDESSRLEEKPEDRGNYTRTKLESERLVVAAIQQRGLPAVILRPGEVVGPDKPLLTPGVAQRAPGAFVVLGNGRVRLPLVHVQDVVEALVSAASSSVPAGEVLHLVENAGVTQNLIIDHYKATTGDRRRVIRVPLPIVMALAWGVELLGKKTLGWAPLGPRRIRAATASREFDCSRAERLLGWTPRTGVKSAFEQTSGGAASASNEEGIATA
jgi:predicted dehydrogenase/nucleoside-diphosphate-sugar epimerase